MKTLIKTSSRKFQYHLQSNHLGSNLYLLPAFRVNNWMPKYPFYHVSFVWWKWELGLWWCQ
jgi:hypothetical protein